MGKRRYWTPSRILFWNLIAAILIALILWVFVSPQIAIRLLVIMPFVLGATYAIQRSTSLSLWRGIFILFGASWIGFMPWIVLMFGIVPQVFGTVDHPLYYLVTLLTALL
ncbi:unnamed protein product, partial [marine sediment metagenome]